VKVMENKTPLTPLDPARFDAVFRLMEQSFPENEYRPYEEQKALLREPAYRILVPEGPGDPAAFLALWEWEELLFLEHFAVHPEERGGGLGSRLLGEVLPTCGKLFCLEVEPPAAGIAARRIGFYERMGFFLNDYPYIQPPISAGRQAIPLRIMTYGSPVSREEFEGIRELLYERVYHLADLCAFD